MNPFLWKETFIPSYCLRRSQRIHFSHTAAVHCTAMYVQNAIDEERKKWKPLTNFNSAATYEINQSWEIMKNWPTFSQIWQQIN